MHYEIAASREEKKVECQCRATHVTSAAWIVKSIQHKVQQSVGVLLQDVLRLLTVWFRYGEHEAVYSAVNHLFPKVKNILQVIPQIVARIDTEKDKFVIKYHSF